MLGLRLKYSGNSFIIVTNIPLSKMVVVPLSIIVQATTR
jgi:hypothetical protein